MMEEIEKWFTYHAPTADEIVKYQKIRDAAFQLAMVIVSECPPSSDKVIAIRKVREAVMTANASIACKVTQ